jgi:hypothetical protein
MTADIELRQLMNKIGSAESSMVLELLSGSPSLAQAVLREGATRAAAAGNFLTKIRRYVYAGDTALHVAAAAYGPDIARILIDFGADVAARNRRGATPLHYAADGSPGSPFWDPDLQSETISCLIGAGANPNALDRSGVTPLHRAVRTRCAAAVNALLIGGADPLRTNRHGSTPMMLAMKQTGRSGSEEAKAQQAEIIRLLEA